MRLLVLGGTKFLGRHAVAHALEQGHEVTTFTRGKTNPELFPEAEHLTGDRDGGLDALRGRVWDGVIDTSGYVPDVVRQSAELLRPAVQRYLFVSTISVYSDAEDEYGGLKLACERVVEDVYGDRSTRVRPGLIVGPYDPTDRFTYWPRRLAAGGDVLAPGDPAQPVQIIDARDLAEWLVEVALHGPGGTFDATGFQTTLGELLEQLRGDASLIWVDGQQVLDAGVRPWMELPLWLTEDGWPLMQRDVSEAVAAGLTFRPLEETARDTHAWDRAEPGERPTLTREKEAEILKLAS
jgi:2'-hydroxyisoflavone reductase